MLHVLTSIHGQRTQKACRLRGCKEVYRALTSISLVRMEILTMLQEWWQVKCGFQILPQISKLLWKLRLQLRLLFLLLISASSKWAPSRQIHFYYHHFIISPLWAFHKVSLGIRRVLANYLVRELDWREDKASEGEGAGGGSNLSPPPTPPKLFLAPFLLPNDSFLKRTGMPQRGLGTNLFVLWVTPRQVLWLSTFFQTRAFSTSLFTSSFPKPNLWLKRLPPPFVIQPSSRGLVTCDVSTIRCCTSLQVRVGLGKNERVTWCYVSAKLWIGWPWARKTSEAWNVKCHDQFPQARKLVLWDSVGIF